MSIQEKATAYNQKMVCPTISLGAKSREVSNLKIPDHITMQ